MKKQYGYIVPVSLLTLTVLILSTFSSFAQSQRNPCYYNAAPSATDGCTPVSNSKPLPVTSLGYPAGVTPIAGNGSGTTGAVVGTLTATATTTAYICDFDVSAIGGTAPVGPIVVAGLLGGSKTYQMSSTAAGITLSKSFNPCIPASAINTNITITTTADGTATSVNVNSSGFIK